MKEQFNEAVEILDAVLVITLVPLAFSFGAAVVTPAPYKSAAMALTWLGMSMAMAAVYAARMADDALIAGERAEQKLRDALMAQNAPRFE